MIEGPLRRVSGVSMARTAGDDPDAKPDAAILLSCGHSVAMPDGPVPALMACVICRAQRGR